MGKVACEGKATFQAQFVFTNWGVFGCNSKARIPVFTFQREKFEINTCGFCQKKDKAMYMSRIFLKCPWFSLPFHMKRKRKSWTYFLFIYSYFLFSFVMYEVFILGAFPLGFILEFWQFFSLSRLQAYWDFFLISVIIDKLQNYTSLPLRVFPPKFLCSPAGNFLFIGCRGLGDTSFKLLMEGKKVWKWNHRILNSVPTQIWFSLDECQ